VRAALIISLAALLAPATNRPAPPFPVEALAPAHQLLVGNVTDNYTFRRDYAPRRFRGRAEHFEFLLDHMEACSVLSQATGFIAYRATHDAQGRLIADNREGAQGFLLPVYCAEGRRAYYVEGSFNGVLQARGRGLVIVDFAQVSPDTLLYSGTLLVKVDNTVLAILARVFAVFVRSTVDYYFDHVMRQPISLTITASVEPATLVECLSYMPAEDYRLLLPFGATLSGQAR
jgi:hypothetical protein